MWTVLLPGTDDAIAAAASDGDGLVEDVTINASALSKTVIRK